MRDQLQCVTVMNRLVYPATLVGIAMAGNGYYLIEQIVDFEKRLFERLDRIDSNLFERLEGIDSNIQGLQAQIGRLTMMESAVQVSTTPEVD